MSTSRFEFAAMATFREVDTPDPLEPETKESIRDLVEHFENVDSRFRQDSI
jgi:hypothetical protein